MILPTLAMATTARAQVEGEFVLQLTKRLSVRIRASFNSSPQGMRYNAFSSLGMDMDNIFSGFTESSEYSGAVGFGARNTLGRKCF